MTTQRKRPAASQTAAQRHALQNFKTTNVLGDYEGAWKVEAAGDVWTARPWVAPSARQAEGRSERKRIPRTMHATFEPAKRRDPIAILEAQES